MQLELTAVFREAPDDGYIAFIEEQPGTNIPEETFDEARANLREAIELMLEASRAFSEADLAA